jgi:hypothetical protein
VLSRGGQARADVQELADAGLADEVLHRAYEECPLGPGDVEDLRIRRDDLVTDLTVDLVAVLAAQPVVSDPGGVRNVVVDE